MRKKYCIVTLTFGIGGIEHYWDSIISLRQDCEWHVFTQIDTISNPPPYFASSFFIYKLKWMNPILSSINFLKYLLNEKPDKVILNGTLAEWMIFPALLFAKFLFKDLSIICVYHSAAIYPSKLKSTLNRTLLKIIAFTHSRNIYVSKFVKAYWSQKGDAIRRPVLLSKKRVSNKGEFIVGFLGRLSTEKGPDWFCETAELVKSSFPQAKFTIGGTGPMEASLKDIYPDIKFLGWVKDTSLFFRDVDILLVTSRTEGYPLAAVEALENGIPILGFRVGGLPEVVDDRNLRWLIDIGDVSFLADCLINFLNNFHDHYDAYFMRSDKEDNARLKLDNWTKLILD